MRGRNSLRDETSAPGQVPACVSLAAGPWVGDPYPCFLTSLSCPEAGKARACNAPNWMRAPGCAQPVATSDFFLAALTNTSCRRWNYLQSTQRRIRQPGPWHDTGFIAHLKRESKWIFENSLSIREVCLFLITCLYLWIFCQI